MSDHKVSKGIDGFTKIRLLPELEYNFSLSPLGTKLVKIGRANCGSLAFDTNWVRDIFLSNAT